MSRLDYCQYELVDDCYDWKNDNCDECNIFKAYCEGARRAKNSIVLCKDCRHSRVYQTDSKGTMQTYCVAFVMSRTVTDDDFCSWGERREK